MDGIERARFDHIGVITEEQHDGEVFVDATRVWVTNPRDHPFHVEYLRFEPDTTVTGPCATSRTSPTASTTSHAAIEGHELLLGAVRGRRRLLSRRVRAHRRCGRGVHAVREPR